jgi:dTDP-glucose 4,6-dehydratase
VYGEQASEVPYFDEGSPLNAKTPYSASKAAADLLVRAYMQTYPELDICMTHCANNYGPYQFPEKLIPLAISNLLRGRKVQVYGDGLQKRDWLHVLDHCRGIDLVLHRDRSSISKTAATSPSELPIFDFSARQEMTNLALIKIICHELNVDFNESVDFVTDRPNHDRRYLINPTKAETTLGFKPRIPLEKGIRETVNWYVENRQWWEIIIERTGNLEINWATHASQRQAEGANTNSF